MSTHYKATVFIPTYYGEDLLEEVLTSVFNQKVDFLFEVLVYDTSSKDETPNIIEKFAKKYSNFRHKTITKEQFSHGRTRNDAANDAKGEIVVYLTQDATPAHDRWLYEIIQPFAIAEDIVAVLGKQDPRPKALPLLKTEITAVFGNFGPDLGTSVYYKDDFVTSQAELDFISFYSDVNSAARKSFLTNIVGYQDVPYSEDQLFGRDLIQAGYKKAYAPRANVLHTNEIKLGEYKQRMFDEVVGLRKVGIPVEVPGIKTVTKLIAKGVLRDTRNIFRDRNYSFKRKIYWFLVNPLFHIEKWKGVRAGAAVDTSDSESINKYSLEANRHQKNTRG